MEITKTTGTRYKTTVIAKASSTVSIVNRAHFEGKGRHKGLVVEAYRDNDTFEVRFTPKETAELRSLLLRNS